MEMLSELRERHVGVQPRMLIVLEPVDLWMRRAPRTDMGPLQAQYRYPTIYGTSFQMYAYMTYLHIIGNALYMHRAEYGHFPDMLFVERFPGFANHEVFMRALADGGFVDDITMHMSHEIFDTTQMLEFIRLWVGDEVIQTEFLYIECDAATCAARVAARQRERIDDARLLRIHARYEQWLGGGRNIWVNPDSDLVFDVRVVSNRGEINDMRREAESLLMAEQMRPAPVVAPLIEHDMNANNRLQFAMQRGDQDEVFATAAGQRRA
jgi:hypothetical protein